MLKRIKQLDRKLQNLPKPQENRKDQINMLRRTLNMSMEQMGKKMGLSAQAVYALEKREKEGKITLQKLQEAAHVLGMHLHYVFIPIHGSIENLVDKKARIAAAKILEKSNTTMELEEQGASNLEKKYLLEELTNELKTTLNKIIWD